MTTVPAITGGKWNFNADRAGTWRWSLTAPTREVICASTMAYPTRADAVKNARQHGYSQAELGSTGSFPGLRRFKTTR